MKHHSLAFCIGLSLACAAAGAGSAQPAGPSEDYKIDQELTETSPDGATTVEQYAKPAPDGSYNWQSWARRNDGQVLLKPEQSDYPAGFRFTADSQWLVRMQKSGAGAAELYLYRSGPQGFESATAKPLSEMAWAHFYSLPASRKIIKPDFHISAVLVKGTTENYRELGVNWPANRYLVVTLSGAAEPNGRHGQVDSVRGWRCRYDLQKGTFDVPAEFSAHNAQALAPAH
jgi:hypothetical protein